MYMDESAARALDYSTLLGPTRADFEMFGYILRDACTPTLAGIVWSWRWSGVELGDEEYIISYVPNADFHK